jgi:hypothetical protein
MQLKVVERFLEILFFLKNIKRGKIVMNKHNCNCMDIRSFQEIRKQFPNEFLILVHPREVQIDQHWIEVTGAEEVIAFDSGEEMFREYKELKKKDQQIRFCTPYYKEKFTIEQIPTLGIYGL